MENLIKKLEQKSMEAAMKAAVSLVEREAKKKCPADTGRLRRSIQSEVRTEGNKVVGEVFTDVEYAPCIEYGTGLFNDGAKPQPFLVPALTENRQKIVETFGGILNG